MEEKLMRLSSTIKKSQGDFSTISKSMDFLTFIGILFQEVTGVVEEVSKSISDQNYVYHCNDFIILISQSNPKIYEKNQNEGHLDQN